MGQKGISDTIVQNFDRAAAPFPPLFQRPFKPIDCVDALLSSMKKIRTAKVQSNNCE